MSTFSGNHFIPLGLTVLENNSLGLINVHWIPINAQSSGLIISVAYWNRGDSFAINYQLHPLCDPCCWNWFGLGHFIRMKIYCFMAHIISICFCWLFLRFIKKWDIELLLMVKIPNCSSEFFDEIFKAITNRSYILLHTLTKSFCN